MKQLTLIGLALLSVQVIYAQQPIPAGQQSKTIALKGGTIHVGNGQVLENTSITFENGKIKTIGKTFIADEVIDVSGKHIYPGFIAANSALGLAEIEAVRATRDFQEVGDNNPNVRSAISYNTDSKVTPTVRYNGVLLAQITPQGGTISGQSSIMELDGWNWDDALYKGEDGLHINWPSMVVWKTTWAEPEEAQRDRMEKSIGAIKTLFKEAKSYSESKNETMNLKLEGMRGLFNGTKRLYVHANNVKEIVAAVDFSKQMGVKMVLVEGVDSWMVTDLLKENNIPVIVRQTHALPTREDEDVDQSYKLPALLHQAGILVGIQVEGFWQQRNIPFNAGSAAAYGLKREEALASVSLNMAKIMGIDKTLGSLEVGKDATFFVSTGDALDMRTNNVEQAYIRGRKLALTSIQTQLNKTYMDKYGLKQ